MASAPTHIKSGSVVVAIDDLTADDLAHLLDCKRAEPVGERARDDAEVRRAMWALLRLMPRRTATELARLIDTEHPRLVLAEHWHDFATARFGSASPRTLGYYANAAASVAA